MQSCRRSGRESDGIISEGGMESCETAEIRVLDHFREVTKMVLLGSGAKRNI